eukprot:Pgem_evm1s2802
MSKNKEDAPKRKESKIDVLVRTFSEEDMLGGNSSNTIPKANKELNQLSSSGKFKSISSIKSTFENEEGIDDGSGRISVKKLSQTFNQHHTTSDSDSDTNRATGSYRRNTTGPKSSP